MPMGCKENYEPSPLHKNFHKVYGISTAPSPFSPLSSQLISLCVHLCSPSMPYDDGKMHYPTEKADTKLLNIREHIHDNHKGFLRQIWPTNWHA